MKTGARRTSIIVFVTSVLAASVALGSWSSLAADNVTALEPGARHFGKSYNELAGDWWAWAGQFPFEGNPITEDGPVDCTRGQAGKIWFLAGNFGGAAGEANPAIRSCTIPSGRALFIPLANSLFWAPEDGTTVADVRKRSNDAIAPISELSLVVDGVALPDPFAYRAQSPPQGFTLPCGPLLADFGFDCALGPRHPAVADGYWVLLPPLHQGVHTIVIHSGDDAGLNVDVTYTLTVGRGR